MARSGIVIGLIAIALAVAWSRQDNTALATRKIRVFLSSEHVDPLLETYKERIGADYEGYRNHVLRVLSYAIHFLDDESLVPVVAAALVRSSRTMYSARCQS